MDKLVKKSCAYYRPSTGKKPLPDSAWGEQRPWLDTKKPEAVLRASQRAEAYLPSARLMNFPSAVLILIFSPLEMYSGT
ncbi:hypothetical protein GCM10025772_09170 [Ferrimonas gelatinilytica]|uniref:Uncharacterized protein n=1 Tax=Ferrimonas gelatinilytica TaxID=1255257 RepID=A0ABP9RX62_9GAMM